MSEPISECQYQGMLAKEAAKNKHLEELLQFSNDTIREALRTYQPSYTQNPNGRNPSIRQPDPQWVRMAKGVLYGDPKAEPYP